MPAYAREGEDVAVVLFVVDFTGGVAQRHAKVVIAQADGVVDAGKPVADVVGIVDGLRGLNYSISTKKKLPLMTRKSKFDT
ncbi:MAG: hypothetical protein K9H16_08770 [Bacteroidales bacterium]|nr:hypothetical protein [Bacteroidales bacterium]